MTAASAKAFVASIDIDTLPVFARTIAELAKLSPRGERAPLPELTEVVLHDPLLTLRLLAAVNNRRSRLGAEITTVEHAIMMMGVQPFFQRFSRLVSVEDHLRSKPAALLALRRTASRAHHAAYQARDWAIYRADIESEEVSSPPPWPNCRRWCWSASRRTTSPNSVWKNCAQPCSKPAAYRSCWPRSWTRARAPIRAP